MKAIRIEAPGRTGGDEAGRGRDADPGPGQILIRHAAVGLNFIDTYYRSGLYKMDFPAGLGLEGRASSRRSAPASPASRPATAPPTPPARAALCRGACGGGRHGRACVPEAVDPQGRRRQPAARYDRGIPDPPVGGAARGGRHSAGPRAAGGLGVILTQWAKSLGVRVIATVGSPEKAEIARGFGPTR